jgi:DNA-binding CsgD family transcriptional regulator
MEITVTIDIVFGIPNQQQTIEKISIDRWDKQAEILLVKRVRVLMNSPKEKITGLRINLSIPVHMLSVASEIINSITKYKNLVNKPLLTARENEILTLIKEGLTNVEIAEKLFISYETVKSHRKNILGKSHAKNTASLINNYFSNI